MSTVSVAPSRKLPHIFQSVVNAYIYRRYSILFATLVFTLVAFPVISFFHLSGFIIESLLGTSLIAAILPVGASKTRSLLLGLMVAVWLVRPVMAWLGHTLLSLLMLGTWTLIGLAAAWLAIRFALNASKVDTEHLCAALSAYLLAGIYFGVLYWVLEEVSPGTFAFPGTFSRTAASYFSFITLATVGYGDIVPRTDVARGIAIIEGIGGQLFLAVLVARLVSIYSTQDSADNTKAIS